MSVTVSEASAVRASSWSAYRPGGLPDLRESVARGVGEVLFTSFARRDQRRKGEQYLDGLLRTRGRKSIRNIAAQVGGSATEQSLHHFISSSTWDWRPVREALAGYLTQYAAPQAWVVHPLAIAKAGDQSVGVDYGVDPCTGVFRGQRAFGVWHAGETFSAPVNWRLFLPDLWLGDEERRRQAEIPDEMGRESLEQCATTAVLEMLGSWRVPARPVVLNTHINRIAATMGRFTAAGVPVIARIRGTAQLMMGDPALPGYDGGVMEAQRILAGVRGLRRPVRAPGHDGDTLAAAVRVACAGELPTHRRAGVADAVGGLTLIGEWRGTQGPPTALWVTNATSAPAEVLLRLTRLGGRACQDLAGAGEDVGLKDFEGRSFRGWHRHITLASAAHAVAALAGLDAGHPTARDPRGLDGLLAT
ncbi:transposase [Streptomyces sp. NPDC006544]|uniref:IS701 family transposase n=1 Tax=Streptomyces sp. NPDC006544 TaxID=3154583 RepID=UPI0033A968A5